MSDYSSLLDVVFNTNSVTDKPNEEVLPTESDIVESSPVGKIFKIDDFINSVYNKSIDRNKSLIEESKYINAYDISKNCIKEIVFKLLKYPVDISADYWLPITFRSTLGSAIHDFIQSNFPFTENEVSLRVPSIRTSVRVDSLINHNTLVEIKALPFKEYEQILKQNKPRLDDFIQAILYKYLLENHLQEIKSVNPSELRTNPPKLNSYKIELIQFIYVAHDLISSDVSSLKEAIEIADNLKKLLNSKKNQFYFMCVLNIDLKNLELKQYYDFITTKIKKINHYIDTQTIPPDDIDNMGGNCYFCQYRRICSKSK